MQPQAEAMLLDRYLPQYDITETHAVVIDADTELTWQAVRRSDLSRSAVIRVLLELRSLPNRLERLLEGAALGTFPPAVDARRHGARRLCAPGRIARPRDRVRHCRAAPWKAVTDDEAAPQVEAGRFAKFDTLGYVKVAFNIRVEPYGSGRSLITTETRTEATDSTSLHHFARYWILVEPFGTLIRRLMLRMVKYDAERGPGLTSSTRPPDA